MRGSEALRLCPETSMSDSTPSARQGAPAPHAEAPAVDGPVVDGPVVWPDPARRDAFERWARSLGLDPGSARLASADASFRRYLRLPTPAGTRIVMDAPPALENCRPFVDIARRIAAAGLHGPQVLAWDEAQGFMLLDDLGRAPYLGALQQAVADGDEARVQQLMRDAVATLVRWQRGVDAKGLPPYDDALLRRELALFPEWCVGREYGVTWNDAQQADWRRVCDLLVASALAQPKVAVHRDYMPRNLMVAEPNPAILDFQDAVHGPIGYDLASLLRDAFISWDEERELDWAVRYWQQGRKAGLPLPEDFGEFWRQVEWIGLQRHLKVLGIFCRLKHRDGKPKYSADLPRFFAYAHKVASRYHGLGPLTRLIEPLMGTARVEAFY